MAISDFLNWTDSEEIGLTWEKIWSKAFYEGFFLNELLDYHQVKYEQEMSLKQC